MPKRAKAKEFLGQKTAVKSIQAEGGEEEMNDEILISNARSGDVSAFVEFYQTSCQ
jgi:hypothetical protein